MGKWSVTTRSLPFGGDVRRQYLKLTKNGKWPPQCGDQPLAHQGRADPEVVLTLDAGVRVGVG